MPTLCAVEGCEGPVKGEGYCAKHRARYRRAGHPGLRVGDECSVRGCEMAVVARSLCGKHYKRWQLYGDPLEYRARTRSNEPCSVDGCETPYVARKLCAKHYARWQKHGDPNVVNKRERRSGWRTDKTHGYVVRYWPEHPNAGKFGVVSQHVAVMAKHLGRPLRKGETVHHKNGIRHDNRIENLELWISAHPPGQRVSELIAWAHELLERYKDDMQLWPEELRP